MLLKYAREICGLSTGMRHSFMPLVIQAPYPEDAESEHTEKGKRHHQLMG